MGSSKPEPDGGISSELVAGLGEELLARARRIAQSINVRVREVVSSGPPDYHGRPPKVLCVDDNRDAADGLAAIMELLGCTTRVCYDGPTAIDFVREFHPDACLLDLVMPGMDGLSLAKLIRAELGSQPVLFVATTALGSLEDKTQTAIAGFQYHLVKPVETASLQLVVDRVRGFINPPNTRVSNG